MKSEKSVEISVKAIFTGKKSAEQVFTDLIRRSNSLKPTNGIELMPKKMYNDIVVFPDVHASERGMCYE